jgi:hypothetical protein
MVKSAKNKSIVSSITTAKTKFEKECEKAVSIVKARKHTHKFINDLWKK